MNKINTLKIEKILVAVDGSDKSNDALDYAVFLNKMIGAEIEIFTVNEDLIYPWIGGAGTGMTAPDYMESLYKSQRKYNESVVENAYNRVKKENPDMILSKKVVDGTPSRGILEESEKGFDLIILGSRGHGFIEELILGSVSKRVVDDSKIPVIVVK